MNVTEKDFAGTSRFEIKRRLGAGGFGVVYEAFDRERNAPVALKTLHQADAEAIYRFKQEFRALADITHRNLASLYELICEEEQWFFTMELVQGINFLKYTRGDAPIQTGSKKATAARITEPETRTLSDAIEILGVTKLQGKISTRALTTKLVRELPPPCIIDLEQLRGVLRQLAMGIMALHSAGKLHRDLKPSNVLVTTDQRVVILDFGLAIELPRRDVGEQVARVVGTPQFMSPEQACGFAGTEASDWYSFGVMLFQALTGQLPFTGTPAEIMMKKQRREAEAPSELVSGVPRDLDELCVDLLRRLPEDRPTGKDILKRIFVGHTSDLRKSLTQLTQLSPIESLPFVGRDDALEYLDEAFLRMKQGKGVSILVHGSSGLGKSALVRHYIEEIQYVEAKALVLSARCYERESVPYNALDGIVDALSRYLKGLSPGELEALLPHDVLALVRLFPVLKQLEVVATVRRRVLEAPQTRELRRRAFTALRELLIRLADREMLVLFIDDLQWGDEDSAALLTEILRQPEPPALFLIATYRSEEAETSPMLKEFLSFCSDKTHKLEVKQLEVAELTQDEAQQLILALTEEKITVEPERIKKIARESKGNPYFIDELVRFEITEKEKNVSSKTPILEITHNQSVISLDNIVESRLSGVTKSAKQFLELLMVNGQPIQLEVIRKAITLGMEEPMVLSILRSARLIRVRRTPKGDTIEPYHNRIREIVLSKLSAEQKKSYHLKLGLALEATNCEDAEILMAHFRDAGNLEKTIHYSELAAEQAIHALAFDRAIKLYRFIIELVSNYEDKTQPTWVKLGDALANAGRGLEAAQAYLAAAEKAPTEQKINLQRLASEQFLVNGYVDQGITIVEDLLKTLEIGFAKTPQRAFLSAFLRRTYLKVRGLNFQEREAKSLSTEEIAKVDTLWSVTIGLTFVDPVRAADFQARHLLYALNLGEPYRVARALALDVIHAAGGGGHAKDESERLVQTALALAERIHHPHALGVATLTAGAAAHLIGNWNKAKELLERAETILRENYTRIYWELDVIQIYLLRSLYFMGEIKELSLRLPPLLKDAKERGDMSTITLLRTRFYIVNLAEDHVVEAKKELHLALQEWSHRGFQLQHYWELFGEVEVYLYNGDYYAAWQLLESYWETLNKSLLFRIQVFLIETFHLHARAAIAMASINTENGDFFRLAQQSIKRIEQEKMAWGNALAGLIRAGLESIRRDIKRAIETLAASEVAFEVAEMALYAAVARYCRGLLMNNEQGKQLKDNALSWMTNQGIKNPPRMVALLAPGKWQ
ncbi:MAG: protein kinase [Acidobacteria bacterium]|nr:protein kinase [Acidobacteriota bacterium]